MEKYSLTVNTEEEQFELLSCIARSESIAIKGTVRDDFMPIYKHPLPASEHKHIHDEILRYILSCRLDKQAAYAIAKGDAWVLEEVYRLGAPIHLKDKNGFTPLHLAVRANLYECVMVLLNLGVDINVKSLSGFTPLYLAVACGARQVEQILRENGALMTVQDLEAPPITNLDFNL